MNYETITDQDTNDTEHIYYVYTHVTPSYEGIAKFFIRLDKLESDNNGFSIGNIQHGDNYTVNRLTIAGCDLLDHIRAIQAERKR